jgi:polar amino acid transport system substrate-binding protein
MRKLLLLTCTTIVVMMLAACASSAAPTTQPPTQAPAPTTQPPTQAPAPTTQPPTQAAAQGATPAGPPTVAPNYTPPADSPTLARARKEGVVHVGFVQEPPFDYVDLQGNFTGIFIEVARKCSQQLGVKDLDGALVTFDALIPALQSGRFDINAGGMSIRPARVQVITFSDPLTIHGPNALVPKGNPKNLHSFDDMKTAGVKVGGTNGSLEYQTAVKYLGQDHTVGYADITEEYLDLDAGRLDVALGTTTSLLSWVKTNNKGDKFEVALPWTYPPGTEFPEAFGFRWEDAQFAQAFSKCMENLKKDGTTLAALAKQFDIPVTDFAPACADSKRGCYDYWAKGGPQ